MLLHMPAGKDDAFPFRGTLFFHQRFCVNLIQQGNYTGTMLNQGDLEANEIGERILDFYKIWTGE